MAVLPAGAGRDCSAVVKLASPAAVNDCGAATAVAVVANVVSPVL
jgi:hypothetical protein